MSEGFEEMKTAEQLADEVYGEVDFILSEGPFQSKEEKDFYLKKLITAYLATNEPRIRELIGYIEEQYGKVGS